MTQNSRTNRTGIIHAVSVSDRKGVVKHNVASARLLVEHGLEGDAHAEGGIRQVSLLSLASIDKMVAMGAKVKPGDFAENLTVDGLEVMTLPVGTRLGWATTCSWKSPRSARPAIRAAPSGSWWATASCPGKASSPGC